MKVYIVEDYDNGITHAFADLDNATKHMLSEYIDRVIEPDGNYSKEMIVSDLWDLVRYNRIDDFMYIHTMGVE